MASLCALVLTGVGFSLFGTHVDPRDETGALAWESRPEENLPRADDSLTTATVVAIADTQPDAVMPQNATLAAGGSKQGTETHLPLPRFVSLKAERVNVRRGPSSEHQIAWVFTKKGLPVEIVAEFEQWRRIRDSEGAEGWVYHSMLTGKRTAMVAPWKGGESVPMRADAAATAPAVALAKPGVIAEVESCNGNWCALAASGYEGYVEQALLWGVYPGEQINN